jgi:hypothetical protein
MSFPNLILASKYHARYDNSLVLLAFDAQSQQYIELERIDLDDLPILEIINFQNTIIIATFPLSSQDITCYLIQFDLTLAEIKRQQFPNIGALTTDGKHLFVSVAGDFIILDEDWQPLSQAELTVWGNSKKNAHDILIINNTAYLLDNVVLPIYIFKFDCADRHNIQQLYCQEIEASFPHLEAQWVDIETQRWYILARDGNRFVPGQYLYTSDSFDPLMSGKFQVVREDNIENWDYVEYYRDREILALTQQVPLWMVVREGKREHRSRPEKLYLARGYCDRVPTALGDRNCLRIEPKLDLYPFILEGEADCPPLLDEYFGDKIILKQQENRLFLMTSRRNYCPVDDNWQQFNEVVILIFEMQDKPEIIWHQILENDRQFIHTFVPSPTF